MKYSKEFIWTSILYLIVIVYVIIENNQIVTAVAVLALFLYHTYKYTHTLKKVFDESEDSLTRLESRLAKSKQKQEESYKRFLSLSTSFGSGLLMIDDDGVIKLENKEFRLYFNVFVEDQDYNVLSDIKPLYAFVNQAYLLEKNLRKQIKVDEKVYDLISTPIFESDLFKGTLILIHDITLITNAEKFQKRFTADVSHELRTPLAAIKGFSEILARGDNIEDKERNEFIQVINKESERMEYILKDLITISKMDRIDYELEFRETDIKEVFDESVSVLKSQFEKKKLTLTVDIESQVINMDKFRISQVIINLMKNAINYTDEGYVSLTGRKEEDYYVIRVKDTGIGIEEKNHDRVFSRFYRVDKARSRESGGSGLGLSICKNVVLKHGGSIYVESTVDKGSTFVVKLPL